MSNKTSSNSELLNWIQVKYYQYELWTALYMLEPWEKLIFNSIVLFGLILAAYTAYFYLPESILYSVCVISESVPGLEKLLPLPVQRRCS